MSRIDVSSTRSREIVHDFRRVDCCGDARHLKEMARTLRSLSESQMRDAFYIRRLTEFPEGCVFGLESVRTAMEKASDGKGLVEFPVVKFISRIGGAESSGEMYLLPRCMEEAARNVPCILLYKGMRELGSGHKSFDLTFLSRDRAERILTGEGARWEDMMATSSVKSGRWVCRS